MGKLNIVTQWSLELVNASLTYHEVIRGRPLFWLSPHARGKKKDRWIKAVNIHTNAE